VGDVVRHSLIDVGFSICVGLRYIAFWEIPSKLQNCFGVNHGIGHHASPFSLTQLFLHPGLSRRLGVDDMQQTSQLHNESWHSGSLMQDGRFEFIFWWGG
jgi:hypothetical protein